jgi:WD40 repeat protein
MSDPALHDRPVLVLDPGVHTAIIRRAGVDRDGRFAVTASDDRTVRVWSLADGVPPRTIRLPAGPGNVGKASRWRSAPTARPSLRGAGQDNRTFLTRTSRSTCSIVQAAG